MTENPFDKTKDNEFIKRLNDALGVVSDQFWEAESNRFVSMDALRKNASTVTVTLTDEQWSDLFCKDVGV